MFGEHWCLKFRSIVGTCWWWMYILSRLFNESLDKPGLNVGWVHPGIQCIRVIKLLWSGAGILLAPLLFHLGVSENRVPKNVVVIVTLLANSKWLDKPKWRKIPCFKHGNQQFPQSNWLKMLRATSFLWVRWYPITLIHSYPCQSNETWRSQLGVYVSRMKKGIALLWCYCGVVKKPAASPTARL